MPKTGVYPLDYYYIQWFKFHSPVRREKILWLWGEGKSSFTYHSIPHPISMKKTTTITIKDFFSLNQGDRIVNRNINRISVLPFNQIINDELPSDLHKDTINTNNNVQDQIDTLENMIMIEDRNDGTVLSDKDPDLNMLYNMNDAINISIRYYDSYLFRSTFHFCKTPFSILNANIRGMGTNLDNFKFFLDDLNTNLPIIGVT